MTKIHINFLTLPLNMAKCCDASSNILKGKSMRLKKNYKIREIVGEKMLIVQGEQPVDMTKVIVLNSTSEWLWKELVDKDFTIDEVVEMLLQKYNAPLEQVQRDAQRWITSLQNANLIECI